MNSKEAVAEMIQVVFDLLIYPSNLNWKILRFQYGAVDDDLESDVGNQMSSQGSLK